MRSDSRRAAGGGNMHGAGSQPDFNATSFVQSNSMVVVTINYRLGECEPSSNNQP